MHHGVAAGSALRPRSDGLREPLRCRDDGYVELLRAGIDNGPKCGAVPDLLHFAGEPAVAADPFLDRFRIEGHQIGGPGVTRDLHPEGQFGIVIGQMETQARARRHAHAVERDDTEHDRAGRIC